MKVRGQPWASVSSTLFGGTFFCCMFYVNWLMSFWNLFCLHHLASHGSLRNIDMSYCARVSVGSGDLNSGPPTFMASTLPTCIILLTCVCSLSKVPHKPEFKAVLLSCLFSELPSGTYEIYRLLKVVCFSLVNLFVRGQQLRTERERLQFCFLPLGVAWEGTHVSSMR